MSALVKPSGGILAFQVPVNDDHPSHALVRDVAQLPRFAGPLAGYVHRSPILPPRDYAALLHAEGFLMDDAVITTTTYTHVLPAAEDVVEWTKGSTLTPYRRLLSDALYDDFVAEYTRRFLAHETTVATTAAGTRVPAASRGFLYTFKRLLLAARKM